MKRVLYIAAAIHLFVFSLVSNSQAVVVQEESVLSRDVPQIFSPDSTHLVSENEGRVKIWDARTFALTRSFDISRLDPKESGVTHLERDIGISPDGKTLVVAIGLRMTDGYSSLVAEEDRQPEGALQFWDVPSGKLLRSLNNPHTGAPENFSGPIWFSPDNRTFAIKSYDEVWLWETATGKFLRALPNIYNASRLFFSSDGALILVGSAFLYDEQQDKAVSEWQLLNAHNGRLLRDINTTENTDFLGFAPDGKTFRGRIYSGVSNGLNAIWSTRTGKLLLKARKKSESDDLSTPDGSVFLRLTEKSAAIYSGRNGQLVRTLDHKGSYPPNPQWSFSPDGKTLMECFTWQSWNQPSVMLWDVATGKLKKSWLQFDGGSRIFALSPDGKTLVTKGHELVALRDAQTGETLRTFLPQTKPPRETDYDRLNYNEQYNYVGISPKGDFLVSLLNSDSLHSSAQIWSTPDGVIRAELPPANTTLREPFSDSLPRIIGAAFSPDKTQRTLLATADDVGQVSLWSSQGALVRRLHNAKDYLWYYRNYPLAFSRDGAFLAAPVTKRAEGGDVVSRITIWKTATGKIHRDLMDNSNGDQYETLRFSANADVLLALQTMQSREKLITWKIRRWRLDGDIPTPNTINMADPEIIKRDDFVGAAFSPDANLLALCVLERHYPKASQGRIDLFDTLSGKRVGNLHNDAGVFTSFVWGETGLR